MHQIKSRLLKLLGKKPTTLQEKLHISQDDLPIHLPPKSDLGKVYRTQKSHKTALLAALALAIITPVTAAVLQQMATTDSRSKAFQDETPVVQYLTIVDADTNQDFMILDGTTQWQPATQLPNRINIKAETAGFVSSVKFFINGELVRTENAAPFAIAGDTEGNFNPWRFPDEEFVLTVIAYQAPNGTGMVSEPFIINLDLDNSNSQPNTQAYVPPLWGDCNQDGVIDAGDLNSLSVAVTDPDSQTNAYCDANQDGEIDLLDNTCLQSLILGETCTENSN